MSDEQLALATKRLEEVFFPAVKKLNRHGSTEIVLDSLFEGTDDAGDFVVRFEVTITRCARGQHTSSSLPKRRRVTRSLLEERRAHVGHRRVQDREEWGSLWLVAAEHTILRPQGDQIRGSPGANGVMIMSCSPLFASHYR